MGQTPNLTYILNIGFLEERHRGAGHAMRRRRKLVVARLLRPIEGPCPLVFEFGCHIDRRKCWSWTSFITPTDLTLAAFVAWIALVALVPMDSAAFWCDVSRLTSDVSLHGLEDGRLNPS